MITLLRLLTAASLMPIFCPGPAVSLAARSFVTSQQDARELVPGAPVEREMAGREKHLYNIALAAGQYLFVIIETPSVQVRATIFGPDGKMIVESDSQNGNVGPERAALVAEVQGSYRLEVRAANDDAKPGHYIARIEELRMASEEDRARVSARHVFEAAQHLRMESKAESLRTSIEKYKESLALWQIGKDLRMQAVTLNNIGLVHYNLGELDSAIDYYERSIPLRHAAQDVRGEVITLNNMHRPIAS